MKIAFIGLGIMGSRMAANLLKNHAHLAVFNRSAEPVQALAGLGADAAASSGAAVENADIVFTMLATPDVVAKMAFGRNGFVAHMKAGAIWVDCSTVNPSFSLIAREQAAQHHVRFIDAPVAGSKPQADKGELVFFAGGTSEDLRTVEPFLSHMGSRVMHVGETGQGAAFKMLVNALLAQAMLIFSETVLLGEKLGLSRDFLLDTLPKLPVSAPFTQFKAEMMRKDEYPVQFPLEWMHKDLHLAALTAYEHQQPLPLANHAKEIYAQAKNSGLGREDFAAVHKFLSDLCGGRANERA